MMLFFSGGKIMPFIKSPTDKARSQNIREALNSYAKKGSFGNSGQISKADARKRILAAAYSNQRKTK
jgi:hypothetical protein